MKLLITLLPQAVRRPTSSIFGTNILRCTPFSNTLKVAFQVSQACKITGRVEVVSISIFSYLTP
jgi:hypothetical protein